jgi:hypothetical protein
MSDILDRRHSNDITKPACASSFYFLVQFLAQIFFQPSTEEAGMKQNSVL